MAVGDTGTGHGGVPGAGSADPASRFTDHAVDAFAAGFSVEPNIPYVTHSGEPQLLDFHRCAGSGPRPTVLLFHGGGWMKGDRGEALADVLPWLARGMNVANVGYRLGPTAHAPAAVEDARCALHWLVLNADAHGVDASKIVAVGHSAGAHLALMAGLLPDDHWLDNASRYGVAMPPAMIAARMAAGALANWSPRPVRARAVVSFYGITDVAPLLAGPQARTYAMAWLASQARDAGLVEALSPVTHVRAGLPPVLTVHGDADPTVPYEQAEALHRLLAGAAVTNELVPVAGGRHGGFDVDQSMYAWARIDAFLTQIELMGDG